MADTTDPTLLNLSSRSGLRAQFNANGSLRRFDCDAICLPLFVGNAVRGALGAVSLQSLASDALTLSSSKRERSPLDKLGVSAGMRA